MPANRGAALILIIHTTLTDAGQHLFENRNSLADKLMAFANAKVAIMHDAIRVEGYDRFGEHLVSLELGKSTGSWRQGQLIDHAANTIYPLRVPNHKVAPSSWLLHREVSEDLRIYLDNGLLLRATAPFNLRFSAEEARVFWGDLLWLQPEGDGAAYWDRLVDFGLPQQVSLEYAATGEALVQIRITSAVREAPAEFDLRGFQLADLTPVHGTVEGQASVPGGATCSVAAGPGEHIGWIIAPAIVAELQQWVNEIVGPLGWFDTLDDKGGLIIDWYERATYKHGTSKQNAFGRLRELIRSLIAVHILPSEVNEGEIPPELKAVHGPWLQTIFANQSVAKDQRWCTFLTNLKPAPPEEFVQSPPYPGGDLEYQQIFLRNLVDKVIQERYARYVIERKKPITYSCWAFDFKAHNLRMSLRPAGNFFKQLTVTDHGLRLDIAIDRIHIDFEYESEPKSTPENVALCALSLGIANIWEIQFGDGTIFVEDITLSLDLVPIQEGNQIKLKPSLGDSSHASVSHTITGSNILTFAAAEIGTAIAMAATDCEDYFLDSVSKIVEKHLPSLDLCFPDVFHFADAPESVLDTPVITPNPEEAQLIGARLILPADRAPTPLPALAVPTCAGDFAVTLANDYLNGVAAYRLSGFRTEAPPLYFNWKPYLMGQNLPDVKLPEGYEPPQEGGKYPADFEETYEDWTIGSPVFEPVALAALPEQQDPIGTIHIPITYRLMRGYYAWVGHVRGPDFAPEWWWQGLKGPVGPRPVSHRGPLIDLDHIMTARYGMYRQADGLIVSPPPPGFTDVASPQINPSPGWHAVDVGGVIIEWCPQAVATEEHINVQIEATLPAHLNLVANTLTFLPSLDLTYGPLQVVLTKATYSQVFPGLQDQPELFLELVRAYLQPFADLHPFVMTFWHDYISTAWPLCNTVYSAYPSEASLVVWAALGDMRDATDESRLHVEQDGLRTKVTFRFLESKWGAW